MSDNNKRITVLISGSGESTTWLSLLQGSNLQALLDASSTAKLPAQITYVLSSRSNAYGLQRAANHSPPISTSVCALKTFLNKNPGATREHYDAEVAKRVVESRPDLVVLAGWMHILSDAFLDILNGATKIPQFADGSSPPINFPIPCINLHPALPGAFDGANAIGRAHEAFTKGEVDRTGVMVHRVVREVDRGEPLVVREIKMEKGETLAQLEAKIHEVSGRPTMLMPGRA
jgi:phosphoribosylglycinamide formyltransferase